MVNDFVAFSVCLGWCAVVDCYGVWCFEVALLLFGLGLSVVVWFGLVGYCCGWVCLLVVAV